MTPNGFCICVNVIPLKLHNCNFVQTHYVYHNGFLAFLWYYSKQYLWLIACKCPGKRHCTNIYMAVVLVGMCKSWLQWQFVYFRASILTIIQCWRRWRHSLQTSTQLLAAIPTWTDIHRENIQRVQPMPYRPFSRLQHPSSGFYTACSKPTKSFTTYLCMNFCVF